MAPPAAIKDLPPQRGDRCAFCGEACQRWGSHAIVSAPCGHTFGEVCLLQHLHHEALAGRKPACLMCKQRIRKGKEDVWRLYVAHMEEADGSPGQLRRAAELEREAQVELRALETAKLRAELAEATIADLQRTRVSQLVAPNDASAGIVTT